jgi:hypothetical protein
MGLAGTAIAPRDDPRALFATGASAFEGCDAGHVRHHKHGSDNERDEKGRYSNHLRHWRSLADWSGRVARSRLIDDYRHFAEGAINQT